MSTEPRPRRLRARRRPRGFTLIEAVLAIVVMAVGLTGVLLAYGSVARHSADPVIDQQMMALAQEMLEEVRLKPYATAANAAPTGCGRDTYNDIGDYDGYSRSGICTIDGTAIPQLASYSISVSVVAGSLAGVSAAKRITVTVTHGSDSRTLVGWRTDFAS